MFKQELGCLKDFNLEIAFKPDAKPVFHKPQKVFEALQEDLNAAYQAVIQKGVWLPTSFNEWGSNGTHTPDALTKTTEVQVTFVR